MKYTSLLMVLSAIFLSACSGNTPIVLTSTPSEHLTQIPLPASTATATATSLPTLTPTPVPPIATAIPLPAIPEEYLPYTIAYLRSRSYGGGQIEVLDILEEKENFTRYLIHYTSDGLNIYGFVSVPKGEGPFPIVIILHGYGNAKSTVVGYANETTDVFADNRYLVIHTNMRGYPPSDSGDNLYRVGLAVDVLNLIALVKERTNLPLELESADPTRIGLLGQSLGGGVALRVATVSDDIKAMVLYSSISADEHKNAELFYAITEEQVYLTEMETPPDVMTYISPLNYFDTIKASVKLYHSLTDDVVSSAWATETCEALKASAIDVDCFYYIGADHTFSSGFQTDFRNTMFAFFETHLKEQ